MLNEYGAAQQELSVAPADPLRAADTQITLRDTARGVALAHGLRASFAPKPFLDQIGSGAHLHLSLWQDDRNLFHDPSAEGSLSRQGRWFVPGCWSTCPG